MATSNAQLARRSLEAAANETALSDAVLVNTIKHMVAAEFGITPVALDGQNRQAHFVFPRHLAMWLVRRFTRLSTTQIGRIFGGRDHTTVVHALKRIDKKRETGSFEAARIKLIEDRFIANGTHVSKLLEVMEITAPDFIGLAYFAHCLDAEKTEAAIIGTLKKIITEAQLHAKETQAPLPHGTTGGSAR